MPRIIIIFLLFTSCINSYDFRQDNSDNTLVVEGYVSNNEGDSEIKLSWSGVFQRNDFDKISDAEVVVIENETVEHNFVHQDNGLYKPVQEDFFAKKESRYSLKISLEGKVYESSQVSMPNSLEIENFSYKLVDESEDGELLDIPRLELFLTSNIDEDASKFYIYTFEETWKTVAGYSRDRILKPAFIYDENHIPFDISFETTFEGNTTYCWSNNKVEGLRTLTTEGVSRNQLVNLPVFRVDLESPRLLFKYSVLVNQYAVSQEAHHFFNMLKDFSESSGFLYDVQPGYVSGNIRNINEPDDNVIGIFYAASHHSSRIFISNFELSPRAKSIVGRYHPSCDYVLYGDPQLPIDSIPGARLTKGLQYLEDSLLWDQGLVVYDSYIFEKSGLNYLVVLLSNPPCVDCRVYGSNIKPTWWD